MTTLTNTQVTEIFAQGYGQIKTYVVSNFGMTSEYIKNPEMSQSQRKKAPTYVFEATNEMRAKASENAKIEESKNITILEFAQKVAKENDCKITHKSKTGSVYLVSKNKKTIRISDHYILDMDALNPKNRYDIEIVQKGFSKFDNAIIDF